MPNDAGARYPFRVIENQWIPMSDGCRLAARLWIPDSAERDPVPAILEYLPYRKRDGTADRDEINHPIFAAHGYACVRVDIRGNGESEGLMEDEYTEREMADGLEVIEWLARQPWCSGAVGMIGISWGGFNGLQIAALAPAPLKAVVTVCSTDDRYADDIHYMGGCLLNENTIWSQQMLSYSSRPPDPALVGERWHAMWRERLDNMPFLAAAWLRHQRRSAFWKHGSVCEDFGRITAAVLALGGWVDAYSNAIPRLLTGLRAPCKAIIGPWEHRYPNLARIEPRIDFLGEALRWWDRWLKGIDAGAEDEPACRVFMMEDARPSPKLGPCAGHWIAEPSWPSPQVTPWVLHLNADGLAEAAGAEAALQVASPQHTGLAGGNFCPGMRVDDELPGDQRDDDALSLVFDSAPLPERQDILGAPEVALELASDRPLAFVAVRLCDVAPDGASSRVAWGPLNLTHRNSHEAPEPLEPGRRYALRVPLNDSAYSFPPGHRIRVAVSTAYWPMLWPSPEPVTLTVFAGASRLVLPLRRRRVDEAPHAPPPAPNGPVPAREQIRPPSNWRKSHAEPDGRVVLEAFDDFGATRFPSHGLEVGSVARERFAIRPDDPLSAEVWTAWTQTLGRGDWRVRTESWTRMTSDASHFHLTARLEAYDGEALVFERAWDETIARDHV